jgi:hypothetical protein
VAQYDDRQQQRGGDTDDQPFPRLGPVLLGRRGRNVRTGVGRGLLQGVHHLTGVRHGYRANRHHHRERNKEGHQNPTHSPNHSSTVVGTTEHPPLR